MDAVSLREKIGGDWFFRGGAWWRLEPIAGIRTIARQMLEGEARFATIVATSAADRQSARFVALGCFRNAAFRGVTVAPRRPDANHCRYLSRRRLGRTRDSRLFRRGI